MTHHIPRGELLSVRQTICYIVISCIVGFLLSICGALINFVYPTMTAEMRMIVALSIIFVTTSSSLLAANILSFDTLILSMAIHGLILDRDKDGVPLR